MTAGDDGAATAAAGMNDYLSKSLAIDDLRAIVTRWLSVPQRQAG